MDEYKVIRERTKISGHTVRMDKSALGQSDIQRDMVNRVNNCLSMSCWCGSAKNKLLWPLKLKIWGNQLEKLIESMSIVISKVGQVQFSVCEGKCFHTPRPPQTQWPHPYSLLEQLVPCCLSDHAQALSGRGLLHIFPKCATELTMT